MAGEGASSDIVTHTSSAHFRADASRPNADNDIRTIATSEEDGDTPPRVASSCFGARVGFLVDLEQLRRVDVRVALGRAEACVAE
jgi:hypothetical protein